MRTLPWILTELLARPLRTAQSAHRAFVQKRSAKAQREAQRRYKIFMSEETSSHRVSLDISRIVEYRSK